ncbi:hypothetical protein ACH0BU_14360 [Sphingomonas olei]
MSLSNEIASLARRLTAIGPLGWKEGTDPRVEIKWLVDELSARRVLYHPHSWEVPEETVVSVLEIRREIVSTMKKVRQRSRDHRLLKIMADACLAYLDNREIPHNRNVMEEALERLRLIFGCCFLILSEHYDLALGRQLRTIVPQGVDWAELRVAMIGK